MKNLDQLKKYYRFNSNFKFNDLLKNYEQREKTILEALASSAALYGVVIADSIDYNKITIQMEEAFNLAYPNHSLEALSGLSGDALTGFLSNWKGKYFEVIVRDKLNSGEGVGDLMLTEGQTAVLSDIPNQQGWDLQILDEFGDPVDLLQLKATDSLNYIQTTLENNPDFAILSTSEIAQNNLDVLNSGIQNDSISSELAAILDPVNDSIATDIMEGILPFSGLILIGAINGQKVISGKFTMQQAISNSLESTVKAGVAMGAGALAFAWLDMGIFSIGASSLASVGMNAFKNNSKLKADLKKSNAMLNPYKERYLLT